MEFDLNNEGEIGECGLGDGKGGWGGGLRSKESCRSGEGHWVKLKRARMLPRWP